MAKTLPHALGLTAYLFLGTAAPALAQDLTGGFYGRVFGGASFLSDTDLSGARIGSTSFDTGQVVGAAFGYAYPDSPFRSEFEFAYRSADADSGSGFSGDFASTTVALNGYYAFAPLSGGRLTPYVGAGLAYVTEIDFDITRGGVSSEFNDTGGFAYQLMIGADYALSDRWSLNGELRYFDAGSQTLTGPGGTLTADYDAVDLIFGATLRF